MRIEALCRYASLVLLGLAASTSQAVSAGSTPLCRTESIEGEVQAGQSFSRPIGNGLLLILQPTQAGWILRVVPAGTRGSEVGQPGFHDYAELATPPYQSVTPLSVSTDFALRAQDAVGWNPRRFRFAASASAYASLLRAYQAFEAAGPNPAAPVSSALAAEVAQAADGVLTLLDARLVPGTADQAASAGAVSANFTNTAHTLAQSLPGEATPLGKLLDLRFRVELELPAKFEPAAGAKILTHVCGTR